MNVLVTLSVGILSLISLTDGLNCIVCSSATNLICYDTYKGDVSITSSLSQSGFTSCIKTMYWSNTGFYTSGTIVREGSRSPCSSAVSTGSIATAYCCSDKENCNDATNHSAVFVVIISSLISSFFVKLVFIR